MTIHHRRLGLVGVAGALTVSVSVACGVPTTTTSPAESAQASPSTSGAVSAVADVSAMPPPGVPGEGTYRVVAPMTQHPDQPGPGLCTGPRQAIVGPRCGPVTVAGWEISQADDAVEVRDGVWSVGAYVVEGTIRGDVLTPTVPLRKATTADRHEPMTGGTAPTQQDLGPGCEPPPGGWVAADPATAGGAERWRLHRDSAERDAPLGEGESRGPAVPGYAHSWVTYLADPFTVASDPTGAEPKLLNVAVVGNHDAAREVIRASYGGPFCVTTARFSASQRRDTERAAAKVAGFRMAGWHGDTFHLTVDFDDGSVQRFYDDVLGEGVATVTSTWERVT